MKIEKKKEVKSENLIRALVKDYINFVNLFV